MRATLGNAAARKKQILPASRMEQKVEIYAKTRAKVRKQMAIRAKRRRKGG